jgi:hypothetical protein
LGKPFWLACEDEKEIFIRGFDTSHTLRASLFELAAVNPVQNLRANTKMFYLPAVVVYCILLNNRKPDYIVALLFKITMNCVLIDTMSS